MLNEYVAEALGSFVFFTIILTKNDPIFIAVGLLVGIMIASIASQAHINPGVTAMAYMKGDMTGDKSIGYVASQLVGAILAVQWSRYMKAPNDIAKPL
jgi:glycerol uptake facilitator-like aquaporin